MKTARSIKYLCTCLSAALGAVGAAHATTFVTSCLDNGTSGTLRFALASAGSGTVIDLSTQSNCSKITLTAGQLTVPGGVTLQGPASGTFTIDANHNGRALFSTGAITLIGVTVTGGRLYSASATTYGGCIRSAGLTLQRSLVTDCVASAILGSAGGGAVAASQVTLQNSAVTQSAAKSASGPQAYGGGINADVALNCTNSTISGNYTYAPQGFDDGGGASVLGSIAMSGCTVDSNSSGSGGGIEQFSLGADTVTIVNSTLSGNHAAFVAGGLDTYSPLTLADSTVAYNSSDTTCGGVHSYGNATVNSSIIAANSSKNPNCVDLYVDYYATVGGAHNLVSVVSGEVPADTIVAAPRLIPLANNGGPTRTHGLLSDSPAIDAGSNTQGLPNDQRGVGFARVVGAAADIGAFEAQSLSDVVFANGFE